MTPKIGDRVHVYLESGHVEHCKVLDNEFGSSDLCLVHGLHTQNDYIVSVSEIFTDPEACLVEANRKREQTYTMHYEEFDSMEAVLLRALYASTTGEKLEELELLALINRASEFAGSDISLALEKYARVMNKKRKAKSRKNEGMENAS